MRARLVCAVLFATACFPTGPKYAKLDAKNVKAVDVILVGGGTTFCPSGDAPQVKVVATTRDGKRIETWTAGGGRDGKLDFTAFEWNVSAGALDAEGRYLSPADPFAVLDQEVTIQARVAGNPAVHGTLALSPTFACGGVAQFSGAGGETGTHGAQGRNGRGGESGNSDKQATDAERGQNGGDGRDGRAGADGPKVEVALGVVQSEKHGELVLARVTIAGSNLGRYFLLDPKGQPLLVMAQGGRGGDGGSGGQGGSGGFGGSNDIVGGGDGGNGGDGGDGGRGADGADGGSGGEVTVRFDKRRPELKQIVRVDTSGGQGGSAGNGGMAGTPGPGGSSASGQRGEGGRVGVAGEPGQRSGRRGADGPPARFSGEDPAKLFSGEMAQGVKITTR